MNAWTGKLLTCRLFAGLAEDGIKELLEPESYMTARYKKHAVLLQQGEPIQTVGIVLEGILGVFQLSPSGETVKIQQFGKGDCFGLATLYSPNPRCPYTIVASAPAAVMYVPFFKIDEMMRKSETVRRNAFLYLSERIVMHQNKIRILSQKSVRGRILLFFAQQAGVSGNGHDFFALRHSKTEIAELLGVARPSLSRELKRMQADGLLRISGGIVTILGPDAFGLPENAQG